jgi:hypothetical protein
LVTVGLDGGKIGGKGEGEVFGRGGITIGDVIVGSCISIGFPANLEVKFSNCFFLFSEAFSIAVLPICSN